MKKRRTAPQGSESAGTIGSETPANSTAAAPEAEDGIPIIEAPRLMGEPSAAASSLPGTPVEAARIDADPPPEPPVLPRVATLGLRPHSQPRPPSLRPSAPAPAAAAPVREPRPRKFALLAACVALSASLGAVGGSLAMAGLGHWLLPPPPPPHADGAEEIRALKESVAQLRAATKTLIDTVAGVRTAVNASASSSIAQLAKLAEAVEKLERGQVERRAAAAPPPESTGSIPAAETKPAKPGVVDGWVLRKAYRGAALVEGRYGIIEIEPGDHLPGVGRVEEIKRQDGRWVVVTPRGLILGVQ